MTKLINSATGEVVLDNLEIADTFWKRLKGLQFRKSLPAGTGLLITPCSSLHTCFMRFPIDVFMLDKTRVVVGIRTYVRPWRAVLCDRSTIQVIEVHSGSVIVAAGTRFDWL